MDWGETVGGRVERETVGGEGVGVGGESVWVEKVVRVWAEEVERVWVEREGVGGESVGGGGRESVGGERGCGRWWRECGWRR